MMYFLMCLIYHMYHSKWTHVHGIKCLEHIDQWTLLFLIFIYLAFLKAEKISETKMYMSMWDSNRGGAYNQLHTVPIEL